jgi:hypothetical protein
VHITLKEIRSEISIKASTERVWSVLTDFQKYGEWNPFIYHICGEAVLGEKIRINVRTPGGKERNYEPTITKCQSGRELRWVGKSLLLNGEHIFVLESGSGSTRLLQSERFSGLLSGFFGKETENNISEGFNLMNEALKTRAEREPT